MNGRQIERIAWGVALLVVGAAAGCGSKPNFEFDRVGLIPIEENLSEFTLGEFKIPIPVSDERNPIHLVRHNRFQFDFQLHALVSPGDKAQLAEAWKRHEGMLRNQVISICRSASVRDFMEPDLATLKARLTNVLAARLGEKRVRQLLITDVVSQEL